jgi:hypothetical protein
MDKFVLSLQALFQSALIIKEFQYYSTIMDFAVIIGDRLFEVEHKTSKTDYLNDFNKIVKAGKVAYNKHSAIKAGKFIDSKFYFMVPSRIIASTEVPEYAGLITYKDNGDGTIEAKILKEPRMLRDEFLKKSFYKTACKHLLHRNNVMLQLLNMKGIYETSTINNATNTRQSNTERRKAISDTGGGATPRRVKKKATVRKIQ